MPARFDLHLHSTASDGVSTPAEVVARAVARGVEVIALCDHDTVAGVAEATAAGREVGVRVVPAVELTCYHRGHSVHLLGYGVDPAESRLAADLTERRDYRRRHLDRVIVRLGELGLDVTAELPGGRALGRPQVADALVALGHCEDRGAAFRQYLGRRGVAYLDPVDAPCPLAAIALLHEVGALAVMAHPTADRAFCLVPELAAAGLDGLEAYHGHHTEGIVQAVLAEAARLGLLVTGGTDNHGPADEPDLGGIDVPERVLSGLDEALAELESVRR